MVDHSTSYKHRKITDRSGNVMGKASSGPKDFFNAQFMDLIELTVADAVEATAARGTVEVKDRGPVR